MSALVPTVYIHADDIGLSTSITDSILEAHSEGALNSVSLIVNGVDSKRASELLVKNQGLRVVLHLNLFEGQPLSPVNNIPDLVSEQGELNNSFQGLLFKYMKSSSGFKAKLRSQVRAEIKAQLAAFRELFLNQVQQDHFFIDSHNHLHMVPFVFDELVRLLRDDSKKIVIRIPREEMSLMETLRAQKINFIKNMVLRFVIRFFNYRKVLNQNGIDSNQFFYGVLHTGKMSKEFVSRIISSLGKSEKSGFGEILLHPGRASEEERSLWKDRPELFSYYNSENRKLELEVLKDPIWQKIKN